MTFSSVLLTILWLAFIPVIAGGIFTLRNKGFVADGIVADGKTRRVIGIFIWSWFLGQLLLWSIFQVIAVWMILHDYRFPQVIKYYRISVAVVCVVSIIINIVRVVTKRNVLNANATGSGESAQTVTNNDSIVSEDENDRKLINAAWIIFFVILVVQTVLQIVMAYMDADDAYYVSEAVAIESSNSMYKLVPYTGAYTTMDYRHSLEPFPVWLAFISRITGTRVVTMAHVLLPAFFLPLTYGVYALIGNRILGKKKRWLPVYMVVMELLVMFSLYSTKIPEKFFITRIRQGKSAIASLIIPGLILCLFIVLEYAREKRRTDFGVWMMLFMLSTAGCLCSTLGALLCTLPVAIVAIMMVFAYKKGWHLIPMVIGCAPCLVYALLYLMNR